MKTFFLSFIVFIGLVSCGTTKNNTDSNAASKVVTNTNPDATILATNIAPGIEKEILQIINKHRKAKGLSPLSDYAPMSQEARKHSVNMASGRVKFGHFGFDSRRDQVVAQNPKITAFAENVAYGSSTAQEVVKGWLNSPGHKKNIEGNFSFSGIGVARNSKNQLFFTQLFAK